MEYNELGVYIKQKRVELGVSLNSFSVANDIEPAILSRVENLKQGIKLETLVKIAAGFEMSPAEFLTEFESA